MNPFYQQGRRQFLATSGAGLGSLALGDLLRAESSASALPHFAPKAKRVIFLFMSGGISQFESFDHKPLLRERQDEELPASLLGDKKPLGMSMFQAQFPLVGSKWDFHQHGESGAWVSEAFPHTAKVVDDLCFLKSMVSDAVNHDPGLTFMQTGALLPGRPSVGSWLSYGLGTENQNLPGYIVMVSKAPVDQPLTSRLWDSGFLATKHQGVQFRSGKDPVLYLSDPEGVKRSQTRRMLDQLTELHRLEEKRNPVPDIDNRIDQFEMAYRMQSTVPEATDLKSEPDHIFDLYGEKARTPGSFAANCIQARRLAERDVRFIQLFHPGWDHHGGLSDRFGPLAEEVDQPCAALIQDLKQRDMLKDTLVVFGSEFGRTCYSQGRISKVTGGYGREHHRDAFTFWMAGGGVKGGMSYGASDEFGFHVAENPVHVNDFHATLLHLMGIDHERFTYRFQGRDFRLTDVAGRVLNEILV